ncbi:galactosyl transferase GMA12/MNN10 family protein [Metarhizium album ARSEF 1941]|uniref:Galactosyl transferase GMA12/MNN10 family protein n=1 Tax=Metarhizium album (strain ARSEF 1941) TaxID=1081103 RepID=A0A0B2WJI9_METAS|nr:galactosyl transferase GMA12/MNN10 family protein [Metarhizium album ARSEF 1941]KHN94098.1 galactosyl transferase GMA12/MNN10 family protein [Metarhizium album ARSEF 1941]
MKIPRWAKVGLCVAGALTMYSVDTFRHRRYGKVQHVEARPLRTYGDGTCADGISVSRALIEKATTMRQQCQDSPSPLRAYGTWGSRVATVTTHFSSRQDPQRFYQKALETHLLHNLVHGSQLHVLCTPIVDHMWNKQAFVQSVLLSELAKPPQERLEWIFWADRDTVVLDYCRHPTSYIPAKAHRRGYGQGADERDINLLITQDSRGLNAGVFMIRVAEWSVNFLSDVLAFRHFRPEVELPFAEQTAMERLLQEDPYKRNVVYIPQHWLNSYALDSAADFAGRKDAEGLEDWVARRGDFLIHFAGNDDKKLNIIEYADVGERIFNIWETRDILRDITMDIEPFWGNHSNEKV